MARDKMVNQSTTRHGGFRAVDGNHKTNINRYSCSETAIGDANPWWYVDLGQQYHIGNVAITNRGDCCCKFC